LEGISKVIDELGLMILAKDVELKTKQDEIDALKRKIELVEQYLDVYDEFYNKGSDRDDNK
jgi:hypothetical protein